MQTLETETEMKSTRSSETTNDLTRGAEEERERQIQSKKKEGH